MMTSHELTRIRRQMHRRIRVIVAQRRITAAHHRPLRRSEQPAATERPAEPTPER
jgi:hypothetical protein